MRCAVQRAPQLPTPGTSRAHRPLPYGMSGVPAPLACACKRQMEKGSQRMGCWVCCSANCPGAALTQQPWLARRSPSCSWCRWSSPGECWAGGGLCRGVSGRRQYRRRHTVQCWASSCALPAKPPPDPTARPPSALHCHVLSPPSQACPAPPRRLVRAPPAPTSPLPRPVPQRQ